MATEYKIEGRNQAILDKVDRALVEEGADAFANELMCSQCAYVHGARMLGFDEEQALLAASGFGWGMQHGERCGAVTGSLMALGLKYGYRNAEEFPNYQILKKKQAVTQDSIKEIMDEIIYKSSVFAENDPAVLFYETGYFDPEEEIRDYLKAKHLGLDQEKYKFAYANAVKWNKRFQYIQSQILHLNNQKLDTIRIFSQMTPDTPFTSVASVQENIVISLGGRDDMLLSRLAMIAWLMRDSIVYNGERRRYTFDDMERLVKIQADNYIRYGVFISNEIYRK